MLLLTVFLLSVCCCFSLGLSEQKVVCYFEDWKSGGTGNGYFGEDTILDAPCTHIIYSFAKLDENSNKMTYEFNPKFVDQLQQKGIKVMLAVGGAVDSRGSKYSNMASTLENRKVFIDSVLNILDKFGFDGLDVDWEYPTCTNAPGDCGALPQDKRNFVYLIIELRLALVVKLLSVTTHPLGYVVSKAFDLQALTSEVDWFNVKSYDLHGSWDYRALHHSPLFAVDHKSLEGSVNLYKRFGVPPEKIVIGTPTYGRSLVLENPTSNEYGAAVIGQGDAGPYSGEMGILNTMEICEKVENSGWEIGRGTDKVGPYAYGNGIFVGFDDPEMARKKATFIKEQGLGGIMVWSLGSDDYMNICGCGKFPIINALYNVLVVGKPVQKCHIGRNTVTD